jgi:hypothetical protein
MRHYRPARQVSSDAQYALSNPLTHELVHRAQRSSPVPAVGFFSGSLLGPETPVFNLLKSDARSGKSLGTDSHTQFPLRSTIDGPLTFTTYGTLLPPGDYVDLPCADQSTLAHHPLRGGGGGSASYFLR